MYNKEQKKKFIEEYAKSDGAKKNCLTAFRASEPFEIAFETDVCKMRPSEFKKMVDYVAGKQVRNKLSTVSMYYPYIKWCIENGYADETAAELINIRYDVKGYRAKSMIGKPSDFEAKLDKIFYPSSKPHIDNIYRCFMWLGYMGLRAEDASRVLVSDVDLAKKVVKYAGKEYCIYDEALEAFDNCVNMDTFATRAEPTFCFRPRIDGDELLRGVSGVANKENVCYVITRRKRGKDDDGEHALSYGRAWFSGMLYRIWLLESSGVELDFEKIAQSEGWHQTFDYDSGRPMPEAHSDKVAISLQQNYEKWKAMFAE